MIHNLIPGVLDVETDSETQHKIGGGLKSIQDPRLVLMAETDLRRYLEAGLEDGSLDMTGAMWLVSVWGAEGTE